MKIILLVLLTIILVIPFFACNPSSTSLPQLEETEPMPISPAIKPENHNLTTPKDTTEIVLLTINTSYKEFATDEPLKGKWTIFEDASPKDNSNDKSAIKYINIIKCDESGRIWFASDGRGLTMYDGEDWYNWQPETVFDMKYDSIRSMAVFGDRVYAGGYSSRIDNAVMIYNIEQNTWNTISNGNSQLSGEITWGIAVDSDGRLYFPTENGVLDILNDNGNWKHINMTPLPPFQLLSAKDALFDTEGNYWIATWGHGIWKYADNKWIKYGGIPEKDLDKPQDGWIKIPMPSEYTSSSLIPSFPRAIIQDNKRNLWIASTDGIALKTVDNQWTLYTNNDLNIGDRLIEDIELDSKNRIWAVSMYYLLVFDGDTWQSFTPDVVNAQYWGDAVGLDKQGNIWVALGSKDTGVAVFKEEP